MIQSIYLPYSMIMVSMIQYILYVGDLKYSFLKTAENAALWNNTNYTHCLVAHIQMTRLPQQGVGLRKNGVAPPVTLQAKN